jgi:electron transport complex protein RnfD
MLKVCLTLIPGILVYSWFFGFGIVVHSLTCVVFALIIEAVMLLLRRRDLKLYLSDGTVIVTAILFALMITPLTPWWISLTGLAFGIIIAKHLYGGTGQNLFNPAVTAYIFVLLCFPAYLNIWPAPGDIGTGMDTTSTQLKSIFSSPMLSQALINSEIDIDSISGATPLSEMHNQLDSMAMISEFKNSPYFGNWAGTAWEWINLGYLLGGIALIFMGIISWRIPIAVLTGVLAISAIFNMYDSDSYASGIFHLFSGGTILGAFFIASDPVTASTTPKGKLLYGGLIGILAYIIRIWGAYPDGIAFSILIANSLVPLIDKYTRPKIIGED